jgi:hypothetical protein
MKSPISLKVCQISVFILICTVFQSCVPSNKIIEQDDVVYKTKRIELSYMIRDVQFRSPLLYLKQSVVKEIKAYGTISYKVYDILTLTSSSFTLEDKVFLIVDNAVFPMVLEDKEFENTKTLTENKKDLLTSDSTTVSVVTGYSENDKKIARFSYRLNDEIVDKIKQSNEVIVRYYSGPSMISVPLNPKNLTQLKELIDKT